MEVKRREVREYEPKHEPAQSPKCGGDVLVAILDPLVVSSPCTRVLQGISDAPASPRISINIYRVTLYQPLTPSIPERVYITNCDFIQLQKLMWELN
ncbi:hypothetical protein E2C01_018541 [Portunus trituberculatus]|uniref:Uncharacterized protein n=1 Tax=Portunus trituberculatus TaxID=210409 RepID=A0A5B7DVB2_PORTR|nr:hypothetical protein [Portunus trituberculatus]